MLMPLFVGIVLVLVLVLVLEATVFFALRRDSGSIDVDPSNVAYIAPLFT